MVMIDETVEPVPRERPTYLLHSVQGIVLAAFLGSPLAAGIVMAINYSRLGRSSAVWTSLGLGLLATVALIVLGFMIPDHWKIPNIVFALPGVMAAYYAAENLQSRLIQDHMSQGGKIASLWSDAGIGLGCLVLVFAFAFSGAVATSPDFGTQVAFGNDEVYYAEGATEEDARKVGKALQDLGFFSSTGASVEVRARAGRYEVSFVVIDKTWENEEMIRNFMILGEALSQDVLRPPLTVHLCDSEFVSKKAIPIESAEALRQDGK